MEFNCHKDGDFPREHEGQRQEARSFVSKKFVEEKNIPMAE